MTSGVRRRGLALAALAGVLLAAPAEARGIRLAQASRRAVVLHRDWFPLPAELRDALILLAHVGEGGDRLAVGGYGADFDLRGPAFALGRSAVEAAVRRAVERPDASAPGERIAAAVRGGLRALGPRRNDADDFIWLVPPPARCVSPVGRNDRGAEPAGPSRRAGAPAPEPGPDPGGRGPETAQLEAVVSEAQLREVEIHVVALAGEVAPAYRELASRTGGHVHGRPRDVPLHRGLVDLVASSEGADVLPIRGGAFWIDDSAESVLVLADRAPDERVALIGSDERARTPDDPGAARWHRLGGYDVVELESPPPGSWRLDQSAGLDRARIVVRRSALRMVAQIEPEPATLGSPARLKIRFEEHGRPLVSYARLKDMEVEARLVDAAGASHRLDWSRVPGGWFQARTTPVQRGRMELIVRAESPELVRGHRFGFTVERQCFDASTRWMEARVAIDVQRRPECDDLSDIRVRARFEGRDEAGEPTFGDWKAFAPGGAGTYAAAVPRRGAGRLVVEARALEGHRTRRFSFPPEASPPADEGLSGTAWTARLLLANVPLLLLPLLWVHRRQIHNLEVAPHG